MISFTVEGIPQPRGSKTAMNNRATGRAMLVDSNAKSGPWMDAIAHRAALAMDGRPLLDGPLEVVAEFVFPRPKCHYKTGKQSHVLRDDAPLYHAKKPDADKLERGLGDGMTGVVFKDDAQIASWRVAKMYGNSAFCSITVQKLL